MGTETQDRVKTLYQHINEISSLYRSAISATGVSDTEFWVWYSLVAIGGPLAQRDICAAWSLPKQTVNTIVKRMVKNDYAQLEPIPGTRNRKQINLTESGYTHGEKIISHIREIEGKAFANLGISTLDEGIKLLSVFIDLFKEEAKEEDVRVED